MKLFAVVLMALLLSGCLSDERAQVLDEHRVGSAIDDVNEIAIHMGENSSTSSPVAIFVRGVSSRQSATEKIFTNIKRMAAEIGCRNIYVIQENVMNGNRILWKCYFYE